jgi:hypothetical protein
LEAAPHLARINCHFWKSPVTALAENCRWLVVSNRGGPVSVSGFKLPTAVHNKRKINPSHFYLYAVAIKSITKQRKSNTNLYRKHFALTSSQFYRTRR